MKLTGRHLGTVGIQERARDSKISFDEFSDIDFIQFITYRLFEIEPIESVENVVDNHAEERHYRRFSKKKMSVHSRDMISRDSSSI